MKAVGAKMAAEIQLHNTMSGRKEAFATLNPGVVNIYTCGPTVYDFAHIGNFRTFVFQDLLRRFLTYARIQNKSGDEPDRRGRPHHRARGRSG